jgi:hypothetical protein
VYVTVLVSTSRTWRTLARGPFPGDLTPKYVPFALLRSQSYGDRALLAEKGDLRVALLGDSAVGENAGDGGMRKRPSRPVAGADAGKVKLLGVVVVGDL